LFTPSFDTLLLKLKEELGASQFLEFFRNARSWPKNVDASASGTPKDDEPPSDAPKTTLSAPRSAQTPCESGDPFRYASLEPDPLKEFEHAKWIVLTTAQPCFDEELSAKSRVEKQSGVVADRVCSLGSSSIAHQNNLPSGLIAPQKRYAHSACMAGNKMYIFAGLAQKKGNL